MNREVIYWMVEFGIAAFIFLNSHGTLTILAWIYLFVNFSAVVTILLGEPEPRTRGRHRP